MRALDSKPWEPIWSTTRVACRSAYISTKKFCKLASKLLAVQAAAFAAFVVLLHVDEGRFACMRTTAHHVCGVVLFGCQDREVFFPRVRRKPRLKIRLAHLSILLRCVETSVQSGGKMGISSRLLADRQATARISMPEAPHVPQQAVRLGERAETVTGQGRPVYEGHR